MGLNQKDMDDSKVITIKNQKFLDRENIENLNYLYPNGHRITHQMRWFKGSRNRHLQSDIAV